MNHIINVNLPVLGKEMIVNVIDGSIAAKLALTYKKRKNIKQQKLVLYGGSLKENGQFITFFFEPKTFRSSQREEITEWFHRHGGSAYFVYR